MTNRMGKGGRSDRFPLLGLQNHCGRWLQPWNQEMIAPWQESDDKPRQCVEKQRHYSANKGLCSQGYSLLSESESEVTQSCPTLCDPVDCSPPGSSIHGFSRQEYWSGLPSPFPRDLSDPRIEPGHLMSPELAAMFFTTNITWEALGKAIKLFFSTSSKTVSKILFGIQVQRPNSASLRVIRLLHCV